MPFRRTTCPQAPRVLHIIELLSREALLPLATRYVEQHLKTDNQDVFAAFQQGVQAFPASLLIPIVKDHAVSPYLRFCVGPLLPRAKTLVTLRLDLAPSGDLLDVDIGSWGPRDSQRIPGSCI